MKEPTITEFVNAYLAAIKPRPAPVTLKLHEAEMKLKKTDVTMGRNCRCRMIIKKES